jgi:hypothetical protein
LSSLFGFHRECFVVIISGRYFFAIVVGILFGKCFATESVMIVPLCGCFVAVGVFASFSTDAWPSVKSLADALLPLALWSPIW